MQKLSVAIITFNEEANIAACIDSIKSIADEIVVVDSFSTDRTTEIAKEKGAKTIQNKFEGHIQQKNFALKSCTHHVVLSLDADERLDATALNEVKNQKETDFPYAGYIFKRLTFIGETPIKHGSWYPDKKLRLVKKDAAEWTGINPHDRLKINSTNTLTLKGNILHYSYKNTSELFEKTRRYADISAQHLFSTGKKISPLLAFIKPIVRLFKHHFLKFGFLEGSTGWAIGKQQYLEAKWKYQTLKKLNKG